MAYNYSDILLVLGIATLILPTAVYVFSIFGPVSWLSLGVALIIASLFLE